MLLKLFFEIILDLQKNYKDSTEFVYPFHSASPGAHHGTFIKTKKSALVQ